MKRNVFCVIAIILGTLPGLVFGGAKSDSAGKGGSVSLQNISDFRDKNGNPTEVVFWHSFAGVTGKAFESIIQTYNETEGAKKGIKVNLVFQGYQGTDKVILAYQTKDIENTPDINVGLTSTIPSMKDLSWTVSLDNFLADKNSKISKNTFYPSLQRACTYEGEMWGIPFSNSIPLLYYNVDALKQAGFNAPPATMDELIKYVEKLTVKDASGKVTRYGLNMQVKRYQLVEFVVSQNSKSFFGNNEGGRSAPMTKITAGEDGTLKKFLEKMDKLLTTGGYKYIEDKPNEEFAQGLSAMVIMSSSRMGTIDSLVNNVPGKYMTAFLPKVNTGDTNGAAIGGSCLSLFNRGNPVRLAAAWDVLQYCVNPRSQFIFSTASGYIPVNVETEKLPEMIAYYKEKPQYKVALDQMKAANPLSQEPLDITYNDINKIITNVMIEFCERKINADEAVKKIVDKCNASLDEYHAANG